MQFSRRTSFVILAAWVLAVSGCSDEPKLTDEELARLDERAREIDRQHQEAAERRRQELAKRGSLVSDNVGADPAASPNDRSSESRPSPPSTSPKRPPSGDNSVQPAATPDTAAAAKDAAKADAAALARARSPAALRWRQLRSGMKQDDVRKLLGAPTSTAADIVVVYWYYGSGPTAGKVSFLKGSGQLLAWDEPLD